MQILKPSSPVWVGISGGSGAWYAKALVEKLIEKYGSVDLTCTEPGLLVMKHELGVQGSLDSFPVNELWGDAKINYYKNNNLFAPMATGSNAYKAGIIVPCSMATLGRIAGGISESLLTRAADVQLKERRKLILVPRETPYSTIHLENMLKISQAGGIILPASPGFYNDPKTLDDCVEFIVNRIMKFLIDEL